MVLPLETSLVDLRREVATRCGLNSTGKMGERFNALILSHLNQAQKEIYLRAYWARLQRKISVPLQAGVTDYDIPDATTLGGIHRVTVQNNAAPPHEYALIYEDALETQDYLTINNTKPMYFQLINDIIRVVPQPDTSVYPNLFMYCELAAVPLVAETDLASVDSEALIQNATIKTKIFLGVGGDIGEAKATYERYMLDLRSNIGMSRSYPIASRKIDGPIYWKAPSVNAYSTPFAPDWNPGDGLW